MKNTWQLERRELFIFLLYLSTSWTYNHGCKRCKMDCKLSWCPDEAISKQCEIIILDARRLQGRGIAQSLKSRIWMVIMGATLRPNRPSAGKYLNFSPQRPSPILSLVPSLGSPLSDPFSYPAFYLLPPLIFLGSLPLDELGPYVKLFAD